jgi:hypothetical protein
LIEQNDPVFIGVKIRTVSRLYPGTRTSMQEYNGFASGIAALLPIENMFFGYGKKPALVRFDRRITSSHFLAL